MEPSLAQIARIQQMMICIHLAHYELERGIPESDDEELGGDLPRDQPARRPLRVRRLHGEAGHIHGNIYSGDWW